MSDNLLEFLLGFVIVTIFIVIGIGIYFDIQDHSRDYQWLNENCQFAGSRVEKGFGAQTIYMYKCQDGTTRETTRKPRQ